VTAAVPAEARGKPIEIWFQDEARIGQKGSLTRLWAKRGSRPRAPRDRRYEWAYLFGAVCPAAAKGAALVLPFANADAMNRHLQEIALAVAPGAHAVVVTDGAGYHAAATLAVPQNITILTLPPYSPELNSTENIWQYLRQNFLANRVFDDYDAILAACCDAWNAFVKLPDLVRSISQRSWAVIH
jgi:transposase